LLVMAALPAQIAAAVLLMTTRMLPISAAYTAAVEDDPGLRCLCGAFFKCRCGISSSRPTGRKEEKCAGRSRDRCNRAGNRGGVKSAYQRGAGGAENAAE
jgi:hypothetical protein